LLVKLIILLVIEPLYNIIINVSFTFEMVYIFM